MYQLKLLDFILYNNKSENMISVDIVKITLTGNGTEFISDISMSVIIVQTANRKVLIRALCKHCLHF